MHGINPIDPGRIINWGNTSLDYASHRPGPPPSFYSRLYALGVGLENQKILDIGTGTGVLAREFAKQGANVTGTDISAEQIEAARKLATDQKLKVNFLVSPSETLPFENESFDVITANQCWLYFDKVKTIPEVKRLLKPGGVFMTSHFSWLPQLDPVAKLSEELILKFNPSWTAHSWNGEVPAFPEWAKNHFKLSGMFYYDELVPFTHESWRGRIRACRGVGAALSPEEVKEFDEAHKKLLEQSVPKSFAVLHRIDAHLFKV